MARHVFADHTAQTSWVEVDFCPAPLYNEHKCFTGGQSYVVFQKIAQLVSGADHAGGNGAAGFCQR